VGIAAPPSKAKMRARQARALFFREDAKPFSVVIALDTKRIGKRQQIETK
jgi:hypothetical protein